MGDRSHGVTAQRWLENWDSPAGRRISFSCVYLFFLSTCSFSFFSFPFFSGCVWIEEVRHKHTETRSVLLPNNAPSWHFVSAVLLKYHIWCPSDHFPSSFGYVELVWRIRPTRPNTTTCWATSCSHTLLFITSFNSSPTFFYIYISLFFSPLPPRLQTSCRVRPSRRPSPFFFFSPCLFHLHWWDT